MANRKDKIEMAGLELQVERVSDDALKSARRGREREENPFDELVAASLAEGSTMAVSVPTDQALMAYSKVNGAAKFLNLGVSVQLQDSKGEVIDRAALTLNEEGKREYRGRNVKVVFRAKAQRKQFTRKATVETVEQ